MPRSQLFLMKSHDKAVLAVCLALGLAATAWTQEKEQTLDNPAFAELQAVQRAPFTLLNDRARSERTSADERRALGEAANLLSFALAEKFYDDYPADARRWTAAAMMLRIRRNFTGEKAAERQAAWGQRRAILLEELLKAPDVTPVLIANTLEQEVYKLIGRGGQPATANLAEAGQRLQQMAEKVPDSDRRSFAERHYLEALKDSDPAAVEAQLRRSATEKAANPRLAAQAEGMLRIIEGKNVPLNLKFTALDGRGVDLADYRGKVVLIDFWATWCVPCMKEMPNVKRVYQAYQNRGFEIIGISLDAAPRNPAKPRSHEKPAEQLKEFLVKEGMTWPQHYDGKWWDNEYSRRYALGSIPATFLLGKDGRIYSTDNHGEHLEKNVRHLLGL